MKKEFRIKKSEDIESLIKEKKSVSGKNLILYTSENQDHDHFHYALSVSKKSGNAVNRNLLKRRIRSAVRELNVSDNFDFFIILKKTVSDISFDEIKKELTALFEKTNILEK